jgi:hypothetical protein
METLTRDDGKPLGASDKECRVHQGRGCLCGADQGGEEAARMRRLEFHFIRAVSGATFCVASLLGLILMVGQLRMGAVVAEDATSQARPSQRPDAASHDVLDTRTPLPLTAMMAEHQKRNMRDHLAAIQEIVAALAADEMSAVEKAARRIGYSDTMAQMCQHMGAAAPGFADMALAFHRTADTIGDAAQRGDRNAATGALAATLHTCVGCHASYRQQIVDQATWQRLTTGPERR